MNNKSKIIFLICIISLTLFLVACEKTEETKIENPNENKSISKNEDITNNQSTIVVPKLYREYNPIYDPEELFSCALSLSNLTEEDKIPDEQAKIRYPIFDIEGVTISLRSNLPATIKEVNGNEIAVIHVQNSDQTASVIEAVSRRLENISEFSDDNKEQYIIAQKEGDLIVVISKNAREIYNKISTEFNIED